MQGGDYHPVSRARAGPIAAAAGRRRDGWERAASGSFETLLWGMRVARACMRVGIYRTECAWEFVVIGSGAWIWIGFFG